MSRWFLLVWALALSSVAHAETISLTLQQAVETGLHGATLVLKNENNVKITGADLLKAYGNFLPNLEASAQYGVANGSTLQQINGSSVVNSNYQGANFLVSSSLNLFNGFGDSAALSAAHSRDRASHLTLERARQQIALDITQSFLQAILDQELMEIAQKNVNVSQDRYKLLQAQREVGSANSADVYRQAAELAAEQSNLILARNREQVSSLSLLQRLRLNARLDYHFENPVLNETASQKPLEPEQTTIDKALQNRRDLTAKRDEASAASADVTVARRSYFPTLDLVGSFGGGGRYYNSNSVNGASAMPATQNDLLSQLGPQTVTTFSLNLNWEIFDRFLTTDNTRRAEAQKSNVEIDLDDLTNEVVVEVRQAYSDYAAAVEQLAVSQTGLQAATKAFQLITGRYKVGASNFIDLAIAQAGLAQAEAVRAQTLINLKLREEALNYFAGSDPLDLPR